MKCCSNNDFVAMASQNGMVILTPCANVNFLLLLFHGYLVFSFCYCFLCCCAKIQKELVLGFMQKQVCSWRKILLQDLNQVSFVLILISKLGILKSLCVRERN